MKNNRVLIMNDSYYPDPSPNGICTQKIAVEMKRNSYDIEIITKKNLLNQKSCEKMDDITLHRLNIGILDNLLLLANKKDINFLKQIMSVIFKIKGALFGIVWPLLSPIMVFKYYFKAKKIKNNKDIDMVICVYKQIEAVLAGILLKMKYPNVKLVIYTLDSISGSHIPTILRNENISKKSITRWENIIFKYSDYILMMKSHKEYYKCNRFNKFRKKFRYLDIPLLNIEENKCKIEYKKNNYLNMVFTGSMSNYTANPKYFINLLNYIENLNFIFNIYGNIEPEIEKYIKQSKLFNKKIILHGKVDHETAVKKQKEADILINFGNSNPCMIPSKIFEYISTLKPIISLTYSHEDSSLEYIRKYNNHLIINEIEKTLQENSELLINFLNSDFRIINKCDIEKIYEQNTAKYFVNLIEKLF